jgi:hypothetical protein
VKFVAIKKRFENNFFYHPSLQLLFLDPRSGIRDPGSGMGKNQDPGSGKKINIPDPQHKKTVHPENKYCSTKYLLVTD